MKSVLDNYVVLQKSFENFAQIAVRDPEMSARCAGISAQFASFGYLFGVFLGHHLLSLADNLSISLQSKTMSAADAQVCAKLTVSALRAFHSDEKFMAFWNELDSM